MEITVTVGNFYECKSYVEGGYYSQSSEMFLNNLKMRKGQSLIS